MICAFNNEARHSDCRVVSLLWWMLRSVCQEWECPSRMQKYHCYCAVCCNDVRFALVVELLKRDEVMINGWKIMEHMTHVRGAKAGARSTRTTGHKPEMLGDKGTKIHYALQSAMTCCATSTATVMFGLRLSVWYQHPSQARQSFRELHLTIHFMRLPCFMAQQEWSLELARKECDWNMVESSTETDLSL